MAGDGAPVKGDNTEAHVISAAEAVKSDLEFIRSLPPIVLKDLLSNGVCTGCILKLFSMHEQLCFRPSVATHELSVILRELAEHDGANGSVGENKDVIDLENELQVCRVCLGILQFMYIDDGGTLVRKIHASDFATEIGNSIKQGGYQIDSFCLEVSLPPSVVDNEQAVWSYIKEKYGSESWFSEKFPSASISVKDFLKLSVTNPLEKLLDVKCNGNSFRVRLTYTLSNEPANKQPAHESNGCCKRRKIGKFLPLYFPFFSC